MMTEDEIDVVLASPWERIGAALINGVLNVVALIPVLVGFVLTVFEDNNYRQLEVLSTNAQVLLIWQWFFSAKTWLGWGIFLLYTVWQCVWMSRYGQSIGKKILNLKVIKSDGTEAGFMGVVVLREIVYTIAVSMIVGIVGSVLVYLLGLSDWVGDLLGYLPSVICVLMIFFATDKRSLQDWIANTVVVKLPRASRR